MEGDYRLSVQMLDYWTNFMKTGDPNGPGLQKWNAGQTDADIHVFDMEGKLLPLDTLLEEAGGDITELFGEKLEEKSEGIVSESGYQQSAFERRND